MHSSSFVENIKKILREQNYEIVLESLPKEFTWTPDILVKKANNYIAYLLRESDTIPEVLVQRIGSMRPIKTRLSIFILFCKKPKENIIQMINLYGIGVAFFHKNNITIIRKSKDFSKIKKTIPKKKIKKKKKMPRIDIFISSHQIIEERRLVRDLIDEIRLATKIPMFPILVEEDPRYNIHQTRKCIRRNMDDSELFIGILAEEYRSDVNYEFRRAFNSCYDCSDIFVYIKAIKERPPNLNQLINWIKGQKNVKYQEYIDVKNLRTKVMGTLMWKMKRMHKKFGIPFLEY